VRVLLCNTAVTTVPNLPSEENEMDSGATPKVVMDVIITSASNAASSPLSKLLVRNVGYEMSTAVPSSVTKMSGLALCLQWRVRWFMVTIVRNEATQRGIAPDHMHPGVKPKQQVVLSDSNSRGLNGMRLKPTEHRTLRLPPR
jgi:hypothetical protein